MMQVLNIKLASLLDLIRLAVSVKREGTSIISFPWRGKYVAGLYLPPFTKQLSAIFPNVSTREKPSNIYSYTSDNNGKENVVKGIVKSPSYIPVMTIFIKKRPHNYINFRALDCNITRIELEDIKSLTYVAISLTDSWLHIPFVWYDIEYHEFIITLEVNPREEAKEELLILTLPYPDLEDEHNFILYDQEDDRVLFSDGYKGISYQYISIIRTKKTPYLET